MTTNPFPPISRPAHSPISSTRPWRLLCGLLLSSTISNALVPTDLFNLGDLENDPKMTPKHFADLFEHFAFEYSPYVQPPDTFLRDRSGDCDDYAILGDYILGRLGLKTRLIRVELVGNRISHVICYVTEKKAYLDYNSRIYSTNLERSGSTIREIAEEVADSFGNNWTTATEYTYKYAEGRSRAIRTVVKTDPPKNDPDRTPAASNR